MKYIFGFLILGIVFSSYAKGCPDLIGLPNLENEELFFLKVSEDGWICTNVKGKTYTCSCSLSPCGFDQTMTFKNQHKKCQDKNGDVVDLADFREKVMSNILSVNNKLQKMDKNVSLPKEVTFKIDSKLSGSNIDLYDSEVITHGCDMFLGDNFLNQSIHEYGHLVFRDYLNDKSNYPESFVKNCGTKKAWKNYTGLIEAASLELGETFCDIFAIAQTDDLKSLQADFDRMGASHKDEIGPFYDCKKFLKDSEVTREDLQNEENRELLTYDPHFLFCNSGILAVKDLEIKENSFEVVQKFLDASLQMISSEGDCSEEGLVNIDYGGFTSKAKASEDLVSAYNSL